MNFTNLNVKSHFSLLKSTLKVDDIINFALKNNMEYVSICDENFLGCATELISKANKKDMIPILGIDVIIIQDDIKYNCLIYAKNKDGFKNLQKISSVVMLNEKKVLNYDEYINLASNTYLVIDMIKTEVYHEYLLNNELDKSKLDKINTLFSNYYYWFSNGNDKEFINNIYKSNPKQRLAITNVSYYRPEEHALHYMLRCIDSGENADKSLIQKKGQDYLKTIEDISKEFDENTLENTSKFIESFENIKLEYNETLPSYKESIDISNDYLKQLSLKGLGRRLNTNNIPQNYLDRLQYELEVIVKMGYSNYFLIVYDYVLFAKKNDILVGPGRGSAAGSLVSYCLGITNVDPIKNSLIFERFLNPDRISMPDIDVDFQDNRREEVVSYLKDKYTKESVAHIITYGTFQAKNSIRDLGRILEIPNYRLDLVLKQIPNVLNVRLVKVLEQSKQLQVILESNEDLKFVFNNAIRLEGINRHISTHAAGIVIANDNLEEYLPVMEGINDTLMVQYSMDYLEEIGIYKMDVLGLKNLSILNEILEDMETKISLEEIDLNDKKTLDLMSKGNTLGVFQFESAGVIKVLKKMGIDSINDLVATTALFRPGPMQFIDEYIARKKGLKKIDYIHKDLESVLKETYGIIVYQEQIMQICQIMAGFSLSKADIVRKGMSKKDEKLLVEIREDFISSSINKGYTKEIATKVYDMILMFSNYGFNKAHAYSYALLGYYLAYLKANYSISFFKSILSANLYNISKVKLYLYEMKQYGLNIVVPNINKSQIGFMVENNNFVLPFTSIKGMGEAIAKLIIEERETNGQYIDYMDALTRLYKLKISKKNIENLIYAGAFDDFEFNRKTMIENIEKIEKFLQITKAQDNQTYLSLDFLSKPHIIKFAEDYSVEQKEFELLGLYLSNHPLDKYQNEYANSILQNISDDNNALVIIDSIKEIRTKKGELMAFVNVSDLIESKTLVVFPRVYAQYKSKISNKDVILIKGHTDEKDNSNIILKSIEKLN